MFYAMGMRICVKFMTKGCPWKGVHIMLCGNRIHFGSHGKGGGVPFRFTTLVENGHFTTGPCD